ncbi:MAG: hypothetical protein FJ125_04560 [Deltaproteobacteria bacterium]|nr:hypothetical protein [Deltaproteobacteria bacterium]
MAPQCRRYRQALLEGRTLPPDEVCPCRLCRTFARQLARLGEAARSLPRPELPLGLATRIRARLTEEEAALAGRFRLQQLARAAGALVAAAAAAAIVFFFAAPERTVLRTDAGHHLLVDLRLPGKQPEQPEQPVRLRVLLPDGLSLASEDGELCRTRQLAWEERPGRDGASRAFALVARAPGRWRLTVEASRGSELAVVEQEIQVDAPGAPAFAVPRQPRGEPAVRRPGAARRLVLAAPGSEPDA